MTSLEFLLNLEVALHEAAGEHGVEVGRGGGQHGAVSTHTHTRLHTLIAVIIVIEPFSAILPHFQIMRREFCVFCMEPFQPTQGSWLVPLEPPKSPKRGPF